MYKNPDQGSENNPEEDIERLFQKKHADASRPAPATNKQSASSRHTEGPSRIYTKPASKEATPAYASRRNAGQDNEKKKAAAQQSAAPTLKIDTASTVSKAPVQNRHVPAVAKSVPTPVESAPKPQASQKEAPAYTARRAAENVAPTPSQPCPTADSNEKKAGLPKFGADLMANSVKAITYIVLILVVAIFISIFVIRVGNDVFAFVKSEDTVEITIPENATTQDIATILYDNGIISYPNIFKLYASIKKESGEYLAGDYMVSPSMSYDDLRNEFKPKAVEGTSWITIPEGYTTDEIIDLMLSYGIGSRDAYIDAINNYDFDYWFIDEMEEKGIPEGRHYRLDGYLFPDTYQFYNSSSEVTVINKLLARFDQVFAEAYRTRAAELGYSVDDILSLAALIEKEAGTADDYRKVSSVFHNRLSHPNQFPMLQSDATTAYALQIITGERPKTVTPEDNNNTDSPYNTYLNAGLPPGPITNPSASAIRYALYPMESNYYYFISANDGSTFYANSLVEHQRNIQKVMQINNQQASS